MNVLDPFVGQVDLSSEKEPPACAHPFVVDRVAQGVVLEKERGEHKGKSD